MAGAGAETGEPVAAEPDDPVAGLVAALEHQAATTGDPEIRLQLAHFLHGDARVDEARHHLELAFRELAAAGQCRRAAYAASRLSFLFQAGYGNRVAAWAWATRARRLLEDEGPCVERGWVAIADAGCKIDDPECLLADAEVALDMARTFGDGDLEAKALADSGLAMVELGRVTEGFGRIDEAMALATSGAIHDFLAAGLVVCSFFGACWCSGDIGRAEAWSQVLRDSEFLGPRGHPINNGRCDSAYGAMLCDLGRWEEAERVLERGFEVTRPTPLGSRVNIIASLADLRIRQGRLDEAEALLVGLDDYIEPLLATTRLHLARHDFELAAAAARRAIRALGRDRLRAAMLLGGLVEAELGRNDLEAATVAAAELEQRAVESGLPALLAQADLTHARLLSHAGDASGAVARLEHALGHIGGVDVPLLRAAVHVELARLRAVDDSAAAVLDARAAAAIHARMDAPIPAAAAAILAELGVAVPGERGEPQPAAAAAGATAGLARSRNGWTVGTGTAVTRLPDSKGLRYLADLVAHPGVERHVLDLVELTDPGDGRARRSSGDAGVVLDAAAKTAYRRRLEDLRGAVDEAQACGREEAALAYQDEIDCLVAELARAVGLGGRDRRVASGVERARVNVTRTIRAAVTRIEELLPAAGAALDRGVRTGVFCSYTPSPTEAVLWSVGRGRDADGSLGRAET